MGIVVSLPMHRAVCDAYDAITTPTVEDKYRAENNRRVMHKFKVGDNLSTSTSQDTWWPDRSKGFIKKDQAAIRKLYGEEEG